MSAGLMMLFAGNALIGKRVVVVGGAATGIEVALWAARKGAMDPQAARFLAFYDALPKEEAITRTFQEIARFV